MKISDLNKAIMKIRKPFAPSERKFKDKNKYTRKEKYK
jgi:hypothetical protein